MSDIDRGGISFPARPHLRPLTSLRFFAALLVLGFHAGHGLWPRAPLWLADFFGNGYDAVSFFFVLSGFVLAYVYGESLGTKPAPASARSFWWARLARIYPAYLLALLVALPAFIYSAAFSKMISLPEFFTGLVLVPVLLQSWWPSAALAWNAPAWSLSVEAFFYLLFPFLIRRMSVFKPANLALGAILGVVASSVFRLWLATTPEIDWAASTRHGFVAYFPVLFLPHFVLGIALARSFSEDSGIFSKVLIRTAVPSACLLILLFGARSRLPTWVMSDAVLVPLFGAVIFGAARADGRLGSFLSWPPLVVLGEASYALYILHVPLAFWWQRIALKWGWHPFDDWLGVVFFAVTAILISCAVFMWMERPVRRWVMGRTFFPWKNFASQS